MVEQLISSELHILDLLVQNWPDAVLIRDLESNRYLIANPAAERLLGYSQAELRALEPGALTFPEDQAEIASLTQDLKNQGAVRRLWRARHKDGSPVPIEVTVTWSQIGGRALGHGVFRPVAADVAAALPRSTSVAHAELFDRTGLIVIATDRAGLISYWNAAAVEHYGLTAEEAVGQAPAALAADDAMREQVEAAISGSDTRDEWVTRFLVRKPDGTPFEAMVTGSVIRDDRGEYAGLLFVSAPLGGAQRSGAPRMRRAKVQCAACGREVAGTMRRKYCSEKCRQWAYYHRHLEAQRARSRERHERRRGDVDGVGTLVGAGLE
ncbi:MAG: PAS domain-containing protein [Chloroflexi bacterium]|nr:PAS domain-containing protein [Chloroflexota bacterium]